MVPARSLQIVRDAHGQSAIRRDVVTAPPAPKREREPRLLRYMAQEPINQQHHEPPKPPPQQQQERQDLLQDDRRREGPQQQRIHLQLGGDKQQEAGTSGSSSGGSSSNGGGGGRNNGRDWLRLGLGSGSALPGAPGSSDHDLFTADRATEPPRPDVLLPGMPPGAYLRPSMPGIPHASIPPHMPRAGPSWLPPWSPGAAAVAPSTPPPLFPFAHRSFYATPTSASSGFDTIRVVLPPSVVVAAAGVWFVLHAAPHQVREPFLPQIPRSYLRIKDGRVTVRLLTKYLANKLGLEDESEVFNFNLL
ncbi:hypothetical protein GUJ93_ZPchr0004g39266 [Zizania palustris]|uniref:Uncharacterized protein n=1 Tax=Zizania palustris TaxID=103762 RepID=A0A8J5SI86_ZIZPA|nr:hypothetical protein GUJ93_ZPchr0004g39266 [Zizania palustris]